MLSNFQFSKASRNWKLVILAGVIGFAAGFAVVSFYGPDRLVAALSTAPPSVAELALAAPFGLGAAVLAGLLVNALRRSHTRVLRTALNHMTQGLCMFDAVGRLLFCNERYIEMYGLGPNDAKAGTPLRQLLVQRAASGTFTGDPDAYVAQAMRLVAAGQTESKIVELGDGRDHLAGQPSDPRRRLGRHAFRRHQPACAPKRSATRCCSARSGGAARIRRFRRSARGLRAGSRPSARARPP